jgi:hypothetical protein
MFSSPFPTCKAHWGMNVRKFAFPSSFHYYQEVAPNAQEKYPG